MNPFTYRTATDASTAVATVAHRPGAMFLGGGTNLVDHLKLGLATPELLVDVSKLPFDSITPTADGGVSVGAEVRNSDLASHPLIRERYPMLSLALLSGASAQLRNLATTAGNILQRTRCVYFQDLDTPCNKRRPGSGCAAAQGSSRYHAILGASPRCIATHPSDMAVALAALDAVVVISGTDGERRIGIGDIYGDPAQDPARDTVLNHGDLITGVELPAAEVAGNSTYHKVRDRASYAFALVSVAAALAVEDGTITDVRVALGGVAHKPWRAHRAEHVLRGSAATDDVFRRAAEAELAAAAPYRGNAYKIPLVTGALTLVLRRLARTAPTHGEETRTKGGAS
ncbi:FAD binding domain-containing protein [Streptomyces sp. NPDC093544]|uniref:FAD binding domain-containing protein n=1 Tax=Streptomyces sp. NPDC093544 TaxID=3155200 RepID=UPI0034142DA2